MDPIKALDMAHRSGISQQEVEDFAHRMDLISKAMDDIKNDTFDPLTCNIPGYKTLEQEETDREARTKREHERCKREEERKRKEKQEERETWWHRAEVRYSMRDTDENEARNDTSASACWANRILAAYKTRDANDYSLWSQWVPEDPVSVHEKAEREAELDKLRNRAFESQNPDFCDQFKKDMAARQSTQEEKARTAERLKQKGNQFYKKKEYENAMTSYKEALRASPFNVAVLANIAQCYLRVDNLDECVEFCTRTLYVDEKYVKALSRRATAFHRQKKLKEAALDMRKALELDGANADILEQHSLIVGDYEDSRTTTELELALKRVQVPKDGGQTLALGPRSLSELRLSIELFQKLDEQTDVDRDTIVQHAWIAYDLVLPLMKTNDHVRAIFRTSGQLDKLCARLSMALQLSKDGKEREKKSRQHTETVVLSAMIDCATAAVADTPRNQLVMFRQVEFRQEILTYVGTLGEAVRDTTIQSSVIRFLEQVVESKSWRKDVLSSDDVVGALLAALCRPTTAKGSVGEPNPAMPIALAGSSICFTLSSESSGIQTFNRRGVDCLAAIARALEITCTDRAVDFKRNVLGFLSNLSTHHDFRELVENCTNWRRQLVQLLLQISQDHGIESGSSALGSIALSERALGVLLNLSIVENSHVRTQDLLEFQAVDTIERILSHATSSNFLAILLVLSRTVSLLCRLLSTCQARGEESDRLTNPELLSKLYAVCEVANFSFQDKMSALPNELWQLLAQIWCHFGGYAHVTSVRALLREKKAVSQLLHVLALVSSQQAYKRSSGEFNACERLVGNIVKVLIAMQSDNNSVDSREFRRKKSLSVLVSTLQDLPDGLARKNVAILLAKLCQTDSQVRETVRDLRGIEMMLSISQSLKQRPAVCTR